MYVQSEYLYPISSLYRFLFVSGVRHTEIFMCVYLCMVVCICVTPPGQTKNDRDLKFRTHSHRLYLKTSFFLFEKITLRAASLEKLPCHVDFPHISSISLFSVLIKTKQISTSQKNFCRKTNFFSCEPCHKLFHGLSCIKI